MGDESRIITRKAKKIVLRQMGGSVGATIPKEIAERFHLNKGDENVPPA